MPVPVRGHTLTGFLQRFKSLAHFGCFQTEDWRRALSANLIRTPIPAINAIRAWRAVTGGHDHRCKKARIAAGFSVSTSRDVRRCRS
jgi:hypothetical protein